MAISAFPSSAPLDRPLARQFGETQAKRLSGLGLRTVGDLLRHYPRRYAPPGQLTDLASLQDGEHVTVVAEVLEAQIRPTKSGGAIMEAHVTDGTALLRLTFFGKHRGSLRRYEASLLPGRRGLFTGEVSRFNGKQQLTHFNYRGYPESNTGGRPSVAANGEWHPDGRSVSVLNLFFPTYETWVVTFNGNCGAEAR